jgi:hypothetical protein
MRGNAHMNVRLRTNATLLLGELPPDERVTACQQAGGALVGLLRNFLYRHDQQVLPVLEASIEPSVPNATGWPQ